MTTPLGAMGHQGYLSMVKEVTWGTDPGAGYTSQKVNQEALKTKVNYLFEKPISNTRQITTQKVAGGISAGGTISFDADVEGILGMILKSLLSSETYLSLGSGNGGSHIFLPGNDLPSYSLLVSRDSAVTGNVWSYKGGVFDALSLSAAEGQLLKAQATLVSKDGTSGATGITPSYTTEEPLVYHSGTFKVAGTTVPMKSFKVDIKSGNFSKRGQLGSRYIQQQLAGGMEVTGEIEAYFQDLTLVNDYINGTDASIEATFTGSVIGTTTRKVDILIPIAQFTGETPSIPSAAQEVMLKLPFTAWLPGTGSPNDLVQVTLFNSLQAAY